MSWFQEVKPLFLVIRAYGLAPYSFKASILSKSRILSIVTSIILVCHTCECLFDVYYETTVQSTLQLKILLAFRDALRSVCFVIEGFVCLFCTKELIRAIEHIERYDKFVGINFATHAVTIRAWLNLAIAAFFLGMQWIRDSADSTLQKLIEFYYMIMGIGWFATAFKFLDVISSLERRFRHLKHMITKESACHVIDLDGSYRPLRLRDVCHLHGELIAAAKKFNTMYSMSLVIWIVQACLIIILEVNALLTKNSSDAYQKSWRTMLYVVPNSIFLIYLFAVCHNAAAAEGFIIGQSFILHPLHITAGYGLFSVNLPLLGTIIGAMTTVLVILNSQ